MAKGQKSPRVGAEDNSGGDPRARVLWLLKERWGGDRSAMARDIGVTLPGLLKIVADGGQQPGRTTLTKIAEHDKDINPAWLLLGRGRPFLSARLPVAREALPGPPVQHPELLRKEHVEDLGDLYSESRYWLRLRPGEPALRDRAQQLRKGDLLLLETDRALFPPKDGLKGELCVVRVRDGGHIGHKLAAVRYRQAARPGGMPALEADTFDLGAEVVTKWVIEERPGHRPTVRKSAIRRAKAPEPASGSALVGGGGGCPRKVLYEDIVAVCVLIVRRRA